MSILKQWRQLLEDELTGNVIPFWIKYSIDREYGGYLTCLDRTGQVYDGQKQMWMQWREVYMFAALYNSQFGKPEYLTYAEEGYDFLCRCGLMKNGNFAYLLDRKGNIISGGIGWAEVFTGSFSAIAAAELYSATGKKEYEKEAFRSYQNYRNAITAAQENAVYHRLAHVMIELNVLMVIKRAFGEKISRTDIDKCIEGMFRFYNPEFGVFFENIFADGTFDLDSQEGRFTNPGHSLEGLAFLLEELRLRGYDKDPVAAKYLPEVLDAVTTSFRYGWDDEQGGIWYFKDVLGKPVEKHEFMLKAWWPQNETATALLRAYEASGDQKYFEMFEQVENYAWEHLRDPEYPEWYAYAAVDGRQVHSYKGSRFKGFFHLPRHLLDCINTLDRLDLK